MPVMGPSEVKIDDPRVEDAYAFIMGWLSESYNIQKFKPNLEYDRALRDERNANLKEAIRKLFELESWESW